jgi:hypothetical protein
VVWACVHGKLVQPYVWAGWTQQDVRAADAISELPELAGMRLSTATVQTLDGMVAAVRAHSKADDPILVFPHMPIFYTLAHRQPPTFAYVHHIDVASDAVSIADADLALRLRPKVIVFAPLRDGELAALEAAFRAGRPSGERYFQDKLGELLRGYRRVFTSPEGVERIEVWSRE